MDLYREQIQKIAQDEHLWDKLKGKTILLSGATGMLGKCLADIMMERNRERASEEKTKLAALSRNEERAKERLKGCFGKEWFRYTACDVNLAVPKIGPADYIIHAASNTHPLQYAGDPIGTITSNIIGTKNLLDYGVAHGAEKFCFVSSVEIYGENRGDVESFNEDYLGYLDCNTLRAGYPESKRLGEALCNAYARTYGLDFVIPRLSRVYGPTMLQADSKAISQFIKKAAAKEDIVLKSRGNQKYSYTFVTDAAAGILYTLSFGENGEAYNIADRESDMTLKELAECLAETAGTRVVFEMPDEKESAGYSNATKAMLDPGKADRLGFRASVHMQEGLSCTVDSIRQSMPNDSTDRNTTYNYRGKKI